MKKLEDWEINLRLFFAVHKDYPFTWGTWDCCKFADGAIRAMTGKTIIPKKYVWHDRKSAMQTIRQNGGSLTECVKKLALKAGMYEVIVPKLGDLVCYKEKSAAVGIYDGFGIRAPSDDGVSIVSRSYATEVFRIDG